MGNITTASGRHAPRGSGLRVAVREGEQLESAIRRFRRLLQRTGVLWDASRKAYYVKPSEARRIKDRMARRRALRAEEEDR